MLDIGFFELLVVAVVLIIVMGPERLPEVAKQAAFFIRKARQGMFRLRSEMQNEIQGTPFADLEKAKQEMSDLKNDLKQFGRDLADSAEKTVGVIETNSEGNVFDESELHKQDFGDSSSESSVQMTGKPLTEKVSEQPSKAD